MKIFNRIPERIKLLLLVMGIIGMLYVPVRAIINLAGKSVVPGKGLYYGSGPLYDTTLIRTSWFFTFYGDSASPDTTHLKDIFATKAMLTDTAWMLRDAARDSAVDVWNDSLAIHYAAFIAGTDPGAAIDDSITSGWQIWQKIDTTSAKIPTATLADSALAFTWQGIKPYHLDSTSSNFVFDDAFHVTSAVADSEYATLNYARKAVHDSIWKFDALPPIRNLAIREGVDDSVGVLYFIGTDVINWCVKHYNTSGAQANQMDTVVYSWELPSEVPDVDSVTFNMRSTDADTNVSGLRIRCFKQTAELGSQTALTASLTAFSTATDAWEHKTIAGASIGAVAGGNNFSMRICVQLDVAAILWHDEPKVYCQHK
jgi:hypothetical protein